MGKEGYQITNVTREDATEEVTKGTEPKAGKEVVKKGGLAPITRCPKMMNDVTPGQGGKGRKPSIVLADVGTILARTRMLPC
eukprot:146368-Pyramimonas_sp.AAC.1